MFRCQGTLGHTVNSCAKNKKKKKKKKKKKREKKSEFQGTKKVPYKNEWSETFCVV